MRMNRTTYQLIKELQRDGHLGYADLADRLGLATKTIGRKVQWLTKSGLISIIAQPNPYKLGLSASALLAIRSNPAQNDMICKILSDNFYVNHVQMVFGRFDIIAMVYFPNWNQFHKFIYEDLSLIPGVKRVETHVIHEAFKRYDRFFEKEPFETDENVLTSIDWDLIGILAKDARTNPSKLAEELGVHQSTIYRRIESLMTGDFLKIRAVPNPLKTSHAANAYIMMEVGSADVRQICETLQSYEEIHFVLTTNQQSFIIAFVHAKDNYALYQFSKEKILGMEGLERAETFIGAAVRKLYYAQVDDWESSFQPD